MPRSLPSCVRWRPVPWSFFPKDGACQKFLSETTIQFNAWKQTLIVTSGLVCGYIYDPGAGDPAGGIPSGVNFLSLPG